MSYDQKKYHRIKKWRLSRGFCRSCGGKKFVEGKTECVDCLGKRSQKGKKRYIEHEKEKKEQERQCRKQLGLCVRCGEEKDDNGKLSCSRCLVHCQELERVYKDRAFAGYGGYVCACCGETTAEFLSLDHINNDGAEHRRKHRHTYRWIVKNDFPPIFQVLCYNCNIGRFNNGGVCPHKMKAKQ
jgi:hypothetical protein